MQLDKFVILLVEDDAGHARLIRKNLERNYKNLLINHVEDGVKALDYLHNIDKNYEAICPNLILLDIRMPKLDGIQVLKKIKADSKLKNIPVVILTTSEEENDIVAAYDNHANSYLVKPIDFTDFDKKLKIVGEYWKELNVSVPIF